MHITTLFWMLPSAVWEDALWCDVPPHTPTLHGFISFSFFLIVQDSPWRSEYQTAAETNTLIAFVTSTTFASCFWTAVRMLEGTLINAMNINLINTSRMMPMQLEFYNRWISLCSTEQLQLSWSSGTWKRLSMVQLFLVGFFCLNKIPAVTRTRAMTQKWDALQ